MANIPIRSLAPRLIPVRLTSSEDRPAAPIAEPFAEIDGSSPPIRRLKQHMGRVARDPFVTVLIHGESGTGKERVAAAIHRASPRHGAPFVVVNCAGLSPTLIEDELFGHVRGAFTGAVADRPGPFERAHGGTVFLDEIGELSLDAQAKLLRALQQRTVQRLGDQRDIGFDVRLMAATNVSLPAAVAREQFREDLFYRLNVYEIIVPPLRIRGARDLQLLTSAILQRFAARRHRPPAVIEPVVLEAFARHDWPGNVRELENVLERMLVAADEGVPLTFEHLPGGFVAARDGALNSRPIPTRPPSLAEITQALERHGGRFGSAATDLGLSRHQLYRLRKRGSSFRHRENTHSSRAVPRSMV